MKLSPHIPLALFVAAALSGCGRNPVASNDPVSGASPEQSLVVAELALNPEIMSDGVSEDPGDVALEGSTGGAAAIQPRFFRRVIRDRDRTFTFAFSDSDSTARPTRAIVTIHTRLRGSLIIGAGSPGAEGGLDSAIVLVRKPIDELRVRRVLMRRARMSDDERIRWRVVATSGVEVASRGHVTNIRSLRVENDGRDTTLTDPLAFIRLRHLLRITPGTEVRLTVTTDRADDQVFLHAGGHRFRFRPSGDPGNRTFTGVWRAGLFARGMHHFGVDAIARATLFDDVAPYDSNRWVFPHVIVPELLDEPVGSERDASVS